MPSYAILGTGSTITSVIEHTCRKLKLPIIKDSSIQIKQASLPTITLGCILITSRTGHMTRVVEAHVIHVILNEWLLELDNVSLSNLMLNLENLTLKQYDPSCNASLNHARAAMWGTTRISLNSTQKDKMEKILERETFFPALKLIRV